MNNYICIYCNSSYYHEKNLTLHYTYCKIKKKKLGYLNYVCVIFVNKLTIYNINVIKQNYL